MAPLETDLVIDALAVARLSRLATRDTFPPIAAVRNQVFERYSPTPLPSGDFKIPWQSDLAACPWCVSVWIGFGALVLRRLFPRLWGPVAKALALSMVAGVLNSVRED